MKNYTGHAPTFGEGTDFSGGDVQRKAKKAGSYTAPAPKGKTDTPDC